MLITLDWLFWTNLVVFTSVAVSERLYKHYLHCSTRVFQHTISSAAGVGKGFPKHSAKPDHLSPPTASH